MEVAEISSASRPAPAAEVFVSVVVTELPAGETPILLELSGGRVLRLPASFSIERWHN